ncbi:MAG TPA: hypothetical protein VFQ53_18505 [Kofleriaceae bacterium]|nr:hypothetical protein [Kofleriaceae bacterium]
MSFQEIVAQRGLGAGNLNKLTWDVEPCPYQRIDVPPTADLEPLLKLMHRRSLEPQLVGYVLDQWPDRPIERALIAWDVANASLLGRDDDALRQRVTDAIAPIRSFAQVGAAVPRDQIPALIEAATTETTLDDLATLTPSLASLLEMTKIRKTLENEPELQQLIFSHVKRLELAHLPSLACAFLQILWDRFANAQALELLAELAIDHDIMEAIPQLAGEDDHAMQLQTYAVVRANLVHFNSVTANRVLEAVPSNVRQAPYAPLILARAELLLMEDKRLDDAAMAMIDKLVAPGSGWRYGHAIKHAARLQQHPENATSELDAYITMFGNNPYLWAQAAHHEEQRPELLKLVSRELRYGSHEPHVWRAAAILVSDGEPIGTSLDQAMATQLTSILGGGPPS